MLNQKYVRTKTIHLPFLGNPAGAPEVSSQTSENGFDAFTLAVLPYIWKFLHQKSDFHHNRGRVLQCYDVSQMNNHTVQPGGS